MKLFDAHNHLQDERFSGVSELLLREARRAGVNAMVVNGSGEDDWPDVAALVAMDPAIIPAYGLHPWYLHEQSPDWLTVLRKHIAQDPRASVGEIGLDRWKPDLPYDGQEKAFLSQWQLAREFNRPASIHCLKAWGRLFTLLQQNTGPACGFVLHSYGGPAELISDFAALGAYFSFPGYYLLERKQKQRETFRSVPHERLLIETDAPDQCLPDELNQFPLRDSSGNAINHPANLAAVARGLAETLGSAPEPLASQLETNFLRIFGYALKPV